MEFESVEKVTEFYLSFAKKSDFSISVRSTKPKTAILVCCNEGQPKEKSSINEESSDNNGQTSLIVTRGIL